MEIIFKIFLVLVLVGLILLTLRRGFQALRLIIAHIKGDVRKARKVIHECLNNTRGG